MDGKVADPGVLLSSPIAFGFWTTVLIVTAVALVFHHYRRYEVATGVFLGVAAIDALVATVVPPDTVWTRAMALAIGGGLIVAEIRAIYRDRAAVDQERKDDRAAFIAFRAIHDQNAANAQAAFAELLSAMRDDRELSQAMAARVEQLGTGRRIDLRRRAFDVAGRVNDIRQDFSSAHVRIMSETADPPLPLNANRNNAYARALGAFNARLTKVAELEKEANARLNEVYPDIIAIYGASKAEGVDSTTLRDFVERKSAILGNDISIEEISKVVNALVVLAIKLGEPPSNNAG